MAEPLKFIFELIDQMSGPAKSIEKQLRGVDEAMRKTDASIKRSAIEKMTPGLQRQRAELGMQRDALMHSKEQLDQYADRMDRVHGVIGVVGGAWIAARAALIGIGYEFGKAGVEVASFAEDNKVALEVVTGSQASANRVLKDMITLAAHLPITDQLAMGAATRFMLAGFKERDLTNMVTAMSDVQAMNPGRGLEAMNLFLNMITRIKAAGLMPREINALAQEINLNPSFVATELRKMGYASIKTVEDMHLMSHLINKDDFIEAAVRAIAAMTGGQGIGNLSGKLSKTFTGMLSTLEGRKYALMIDLDTSPGYESFRGFLRNLVALTDPSSDTGKQLSAGLAGAFNDIFGKTFGDLSGPQGAGKMKDVITNEVIPAFKDLGTIIGGIAGSTMTIISGWAGLIRFMRGGGAVQGQTVESLTGGNAVNTDSWKGLTSDAQDRVRRVALANGLPMLSNAMDFVDGLPSPTPKSVAFNDQLSRMLAPAPRASLGASSSRSGPPVVPIHVEIHAPGAKAEDAKAISTHVEDALPAAVVRVFDMLATQYGQ